MKLIYKPFGIIAGIVAGVLSKRLFNVFWGLVDDKEPPKPTTAETTWSKVIAAAALQAVTFKIVRAAVDRAGAKGYERLTGVWPGERAPDESQAADVVR